MSRVKAGKKHLVLTGDIAKDQPCCRSPVTLSSRQVFVSWRISWKYNMLEPLCAYSSSCYSPQCPTFSAFSASSMPWIILLKIVLLQCKSHVHVLCCFTEPETAAVARLSRAEAYTALKQYKLALEDSEFCCATELSAEVGRSRKYTGVSEWSFAGEPPLARTEPSAMPERRPSVGLVSFHFHPPHWREAEPAC